MIKSTATESISGQTVEFTKAIGLMENRKVKAYLREKIEAWLKENGERALEFLSLNTNKINKALNCIYQMADDQLLNKLFSLFFFYIIIFKIL